MIDDKPKQLEQELAAVIGRNAAWLDGPTFLQAVARVAEGLFDDVDSWMVVDGAEVIGALEKAFAEYPALVDIDQRCAAVDARLDAIIAKSDPT